MCLGMPRVQTTSSAYATPEKETPFGLLLILFVIVVILVLLLCFGILLLLLFLLLLWREVRESAAPDPNPFPCLPDPRR